MKKFAFGFLSVFILLGGMLLTACGNNVSISVSTQDVVIYTNYEQAENSESKEIEVSVNDSNLGIGVDILEGEDCIDIQKTHTTTPKANGRYSFVIKTKANKNSGTAKINVWSIEDSRKNQTINVTVNTILEELTQITDYQAQSRSDMFAIKGVTKELVVSDYFELNPVSANIKDVEWTFALNDEKTIESDGQVKAKIDGNKLLVYDTYSSDKIAVKASFVRNKNISSTAELSVLNNSTIRDLKVEEYEFYSNGSIGITGATVVLTRNDSDKSRAYGSMTVYTEYEIETLNNELFVVYNNQTGEELSVDDYSPYLNFVIAGENRNTTTNTTTYNFYIDALDLTNEKVFGNFLIKFKVAYKDYNFDIITSEIGLLVKVVYSATRIDIYNGQNNMINNSNIDVFSNYEGSLGYEIKTIVQPEDIVLDDNDYRLAININQEALIGRLPVSNPIDGLLRAYTRGGYITFEQASPSSSVYVSESLDSGASVYLTALNTVENFELTIEAAGNNAISSSIFVSLYQITEDETLTIEPKCNGEEIDGDIYLSSNPYTTETLTFESKIEGVGSLSGLELASGKKSGSSYVKNDNFSISEMTMIENSNTNDERYVVVRFTVDLVVFNLEDEVSLWFKHVTGKESEKITVKTFVPITSTSILTAEASSDVYINRKNNDEYVLEGENIDVNRAANASLAKLMLEAGSVLALSTDIKNATLNDNGIEYKYLSFEKFEEALALYDETLDAKTIFDGTDYSVLINLYNYFDDVDTRKLTISTNKLVAFDNQFKGFVAVLFGGYNELHQEKTLVRVFSIESFYSVRYLMSNVRTTLLYTVETLSEEDMSRSYVDVTLTLRPDAKVPTYSNILENLHISSSNVPLTGENETGLENAYYKVSAIGFSVDNKSIRFRITAYSTNMQTSFKDSLRISYFDGNGREKSTEVQIEIKNVKRIENVVWINRTSDNEIYLNLTSQSQSEKNFTVSTSVLPSDANNTSLSFIYASTVGSASDLTIAVNSIGQTFNVNIRTTTGGYGDLYLLPTDMIKISGATERILLYNYSEVDGNLVETPIYDISLGDLPLRYDDIINGTDTISNYFINNEGKKVYYKDIILKMHVVIADGKSQETAIRLYSQVDFEDEFDTALYYKVMNDINFENWSYINTFSGDIDGNSHTLNFAENCTYFVDKLSGSIRNTTFTGNFVVEDGTYGGIIAGQVLNEGKIENCAVDVYYSRGKYYGSTLTANSSSTVNAGLIAGKNSGQITNSYVYGASIETSASLVGGLVGVNEGTITNCGYELYQFEDSTTTVSATGRNAYFGGLVGSAGTTSVISKSYAYTFVEDNLVTSAYANAFAGKAENGAKFSETFAYLYDIDSFYTPLSGSVRVSIQNSYVTYDNAGAKEVYVYNASGNSKEKLTNVDTVPTGINSSTWKLSEKDESVNFGYIYLLNVCQSPKVELSELEVQDTAKSLSAGEDVEAKYGILFVNKPLNSVIDTAEKADLDNRNTINVYDLFGLDENRARSVLLTSASTELVLTSGKVKMKNAVLAEIEVVAHLKMDYSSTATFKFIVANVKPTLTTTLNGERFEEEQTMLLQNGKTRNVMYSMSSVIYLAGNVEPYSLEKDNYQIGFEALDASEDYITVSRNSNGLVISGKKAHSNDESTQIDSYIMLDEDGVANRFKERLKVERQINVSVYNGATAFVVRNVAGLKVTPSQPAPFEAYMKTDNENDNLSMSLRYGDVEVEAERVNETEIVFNVDSKLSLQVFWTKELYDAEEKEYKYSITLRIDERKAYLVDEDYDNLTLIISPTGQESVEEYIKYIDVKVEKQKINDMSISIYGIANKIVKRSTLYWVRGNDLLTMASPSSDMMVAVIVDPAYAKMEYFDFTYSVSGAGKLGTLSISKLSYLDGLGYYIDGRNTTEIANGIRVFITDEDRQGSGVFYFRAYVSSQFTGESDVTFAADFYDGTEKLVYGSRSISVSALRQADVKVNGASTYLLSKGESAEVTVTLGAGQKLYNLYLQNAGENIMLTSTVEKDYGTYRLYTARVMAGVNAVLANGDDSGIFYVCATVEREINGVQEIKTTRATVCLVDFSLDINSIKIGGTERKVTFNGKSYDAFYTYINGEDELYADYNLLPEEYIYDPNDPSELEKMNQIQLERNKFLLDCYYMNNNAGYYINCQFNDARGVYESLSFSQQLWYAVNETTYSKVYNSTSGRYAQNDYFNFNHYDASEAGGERLTISGKRTGSQLMMLRTIVTYQGIEFVKDYFFVIVVDVWTDEEAPLVISTAEEFVAAANNSEPADYVLTNDIVLDDYTPISTEMFNSFDGNGYTIHINSFHYQEEDSTLKLALFNTVAENSTIKNVKVNIYSGGQIFVNINRYSSIYIAGFAINNRGVIYNSDVVSYYDSEYQKARIYSDTGLVVKYVKGNNTDPITLNSLIEVESHVAGFVYENEDGASIVNDRVGGESLPHFINVGKTAYIQRVSLDTFVIEGQGNVAGFVDQNSGYVSASYAKNIQIYNKMQSNACRTAGFALYNGNSLQNSYVEGLGGDLDEDGRLLPAFTRTNISSIGVVAGFVYENNGLVKNAYSNIKIESTSAASAGFVYENQTEGEISICYSACAVSRESIGQMQFSGVDALENSLNKGSILLSYYYSNTRVNDSNENRIGSGAIAINDALEKETFYGYSFSSEEGAYDGVWEMSEKHGISIVSANQIALSNRYVTQIGDTVQTTVMYNKTVRDLTTYERYNIEYGSLKNPIIIRNAEEFVKATGVKEGVVEISSYKTWYTSNSVNGNYRIVRNLDMSEIGQSEDDAASKYTLQTTQKTFRGVLDGNGFAISNISLGSNRATENYGLFARLDGAVVMNMDLLVSSVHNTEANIVGTLAGTAINSRISAVTLKPVSTSSQQESVHTAVQGNNIVGGVVGILVGDSYLSDVTVSSIDVESVYYDRTKAIGANKEKTKLIKRMIDSDNSLRDVVSGLSYAGAIVGFADIYASYSGEFTPFSATYKTTDYNIVSTKVLDSVNIYAEVAGGLFGYAGPNTMIYDASIQLNANYVKSNPSYIISKNLYSGGIVGESYGALHAVYAKYEKTLQESIEKDLSNKSNENKYYNGSSLVERGQDTIFCYKDSTDSGYTERTCNPLFIGGLVGYMGGGYLYVGYNKLNVVSFARDTKAVGGIIGLLGKSEYYYSLSVLARGESTNYFLNDIYASGDVYSKTSGTAGGIIGNISGVETTNQEESSLTPTIVMKNTLAVNYYSYSGNALTSDTNAGGQDVYTSDKHFVLIGGIFNARGERSSLNSNIYFASSFNDVAVNVLNGMTDGSAGELTVGGYTEIKFGAHKAKLNFFNFENRATPSKLVNVEHVVGNESSMAYSYARLYSYFLSRGWEDKYWKHYQDTLFPEIELVPKLNVMYWDWYNTKEVLQVMGNKAESPTIILRGKVSENSDEIMDIDLRQNSRLLTEYGISYTSSSWLESFKGRIYSYGAYVNSLDGGSITKAVDDGGKVGEGAGIILDKLFCDEFDGALIDNVSFYFVGNGHLVHISKNTIIRNSIFVVSEDVLLTTSYNTETDSDVWTGENKMYAVGLVTDIAVSTSFSYDEVLFRKANPKITFEASRDAAINDIHNAGLFAGYYQQVSKYTAATLTDVNVGIYDYARREDKNAVTFTVEYKTNTAGISHTSGAKEFNGGLYVGRAERMDGAAKMTIDMIQLVGEASIKVYGNENIDEVNVGTFIGSVSQVAELKYSRAKDIDALFVSKNMNITTETVGANETNLGVLVGAIKNSSPIFVSTQKIFGKIVDMFAQSSHIGAAAGLSSGSTLSLTNFDVEFEASLNNYKISGGRTPENALGGLVGYVKDGNISISNSSIFNSKTGGRRKLIATAANGLTGSQISVGGFVGKSTGHISIAGKMTNELDLEVTRVKTAYVGGYVGQVKIASAESLEIETPLEITVMGQKLISEYSGNVTTANVANLEFGGAVGVVEGLRDGTLSSISGFVFSGKIEHMASSGDNVAIGGVIGQIDDVSGGAGVVSEDSDLLNITHSVAYGDAFIKYNGNVVSSTYMFGGIIGSAPTTFGAASVKNCYSLFTNFNARTSLRNGVGGTYLTGALVGANAANVEYSSNYYSSGVCLAVQEEEPEQNVDLQYTASETENYTYYGYNSSLNDIKSVVGQTDNILAKIGNDFDIVPDGSDEDVERGIKLFPMLVTEELGAQNDYYPINHTVSTHGITWLSVTKDFSISKNHFDQVYDAAIVGNGHTIKAIGGVVGKFSGGGFAKSIGLNADIADTASFISGLNLEININQDLASGDSNFFGGAVGKIAGSSIIYGVGVKGVLSIGKELSGPNNITLGGLAGTMIGGFVDNCFVNVDITYRGGAAGSTAAITNIEQGGPSTIYETYAAGMITPYYGCSVATFTTVSSSAEDLTSISDCYTIARCDNSRIVAGTAQHPSSYSLNTEAFYQSTNVLDCNNLTSGVKAYNFIEYDSNSTSKYRVASTLDGGVSDLLHTWIGDENVNYGYAVQMFGYMRLHNITTYLQDDVDLTDNKQDFAYTEWDRRAATESIRFFKVPNLVKFKEMLREGSLSYILAYDLDLTNFNVSNLGVSAVVGTTSFILEAGNHTLSNFNSSTRGLFHEINGRIENLRLTNATLTISLESSDDSVGILADAVAGKLKNITVQGQINVSNGRDLIGGVVGKLVGTTESYAEMRWIESVVNITNSCNTVAGGVVGKAMNANIYNASSNGIINNITIDSNSKMIAGDTYKIKYTKTAIPSGFTGDGRNESIGSDSDATQVSAISAGIVGIMNKGTVSDCLNTNSVLSAFANTTEITSLAGGIVGLFVDGVIEKSYNTGLVGAGNYNTGATKDDVVSVAGGIFGYFDGNNTNQLVDNCINDGEVQAISFVNKSNETISIKLASSSGSQTASLTNNPKNLVYEITRTINTNSTSKKVYAYGLGYAPGNAVKDKVTNCTTSIDNIKNDGNIGKYQQVKTIAFDRFAILGNMYDFVSSASRRNGTNGANTVEVDGKTNYSFWATYKALNPRLDASELDTYRKNDASNQYSYYINGLDSYGFTTKVTMMDSITRQYGRVDGDNMINDIYDVYDKKMIDTGFDHARLYARGKNTDMAANAHDAEGIKDEDKALGFGAPVLKGEEQKYSKSTTFMTYPEILKETTGIATQVWGTNTSTKNSTAIEEKIQELLARNDTAEESSSSTVNGQTISIVKNSTQLQASHAPCEYLITATFTLPSATTVATYSLEGEYAFIKSQTATRDGANVTIVFDVCFTDDSQVGTISAKAAYTETNEILLSKENVMSDNKTILLEDKNVSFEGYSEDTIGYLKECANDNANTDPDTNTQYKGYEVYLDDSLFQSNIGIDYCTDGTVSGTTFTNAANYTGPVLKLNTARTDLNGRKLKIVIDKIVTTITAEMQVTFTKDDSGSVTIGSDNWAWANNKLDIEFGDEAVSQLQLSAYTSNSSVYDGSTGRLFLDNLVTAIGSGRTLKQLVMGRVDNIGNVIYKAMYFDENVSDAINGTWSVSQSIDDASSTVIQYFPSDRQLYFGTENPNTWIIYAMFVQDASSAVTSVSETFKRSESSTVGFDVTVNILTTQKGAITTGDSFGTRLGETFYKIVQKFTITSGTVSISSSSADTGYVLKKYASGTLTDVSQGLTGRTMVSGDTYNTSTTYTFDYVKTTNSMGSNIYLSADENNHYSETIYNYSPEGSSKQETYKVSSGTFDSSFGTDFSGKDYVLTTYNLSQGIIGGTEYASYNYYLCDYDSTTGKYDRALIVYSWVKVDSDENVVGNEEVAYGFIGGTIYQFNITSTGDNWSISRGSALAISNYSKFASETVGGRTITVDVVAGQITDKKILFVKNSREGMGQFDINDAIRSVSVRSQGIMGDEIFLHQNCATKNLAVSLPAGTTIVELLSYSDSFVKDPDDLILHAEEYENEAHQYTANYKKNHNTISTEAVSGAANVPKYVLLEKDIYLQKGFDDSNNFDLYGSGHMVKYISNNYASGLFRNNGYRLGDIYAVGMMDLRDFNSKSSNKASLFISTNSGIIENVEVYGNIRNIEEQTPVSIGGVHESVYPLVSVNATNIKNTKSYVTLTLRNSDEKKQVTTQLRDIGQEENKYKSCGVMISADGKDGEDGIGAKSGGQGKGGGNGCTGGQIVGTTTYLTFYRAGIDGKSGFGGDGLHGGERVIDETENRTGLVVLNGGKKGTSGGETTPSTPTNARQGNYKTFDGLDGIDSFGVISVTNNVYYTVASKSGKTWKDTSVEHGVIFGELSSKLKISGGSGKRALLSEHWFDVHYKFPWGHISGGEITNWKRTVLGLNDSDEFQESSKNDKKSLRYATFRLPNVQIYYLMEIEWYNFIWMSSGHQAKGVIFADYPGINTLA